MVLKYIMNLSIIIQIAMILLYLIQVYINQNVGGAQGGGSSGDGTGGGNGGYSVGNIKLKKDTHLYIYIGGKGEDGVDGRASKGGFNGGGDSGAPRLWRGTYVGSFGGGGGATDIRLVKASDGSWYTLDHTDWSNDSSLLSRIIVAGGGGGSGSAGGGLTTNGATQTSGYKLGLGATGMNGIDETVFCAEGKGGSGGGYYGGSAPTSIDNRGDSKGKGGSGYIGNLEDGQTIAGNQNVPCYCDVKDMNGNSGNGYAKISLISLD